MQIERRVDLGAASGARMMGLDAHISVSHICAQNENDETRYPPSCGFLSLSGVVGCAARLSIFAPPAQKYGGFEDRIRRRKDPRHLFGCRGSFLGRMMGLEPTTSRATTWRCHQLSYILRTVAYLGGFEPSTYCLEGSCSIQLS